MILIAAVEGGHIGSGVVRQLEFSVADSANLNQLLALILDNRFTDSIFQRHVVSDFYIFMALLLVELPICVDRKLPEFCLPQRACGRKCKLMAPVICGCRLGSVFIEFAGRSDKPISHLDVVGAGLRPSKIDRLHVNVADSPGGEPTELPKADCSIDEGDPHCHSIVCPQEFGLCSISHKAEIRDQIEVDVQPDFISVTVIQSVAWIPEKVVCVGKSRRRLNAGVQTAKTRQILPSLLCLQQGHKQKNKCQTDSYHSPR